MGRRKRAVVSDVHVTVVLRRSTAISRRSSHQWLIHRRLPLVSLVSLQQFVDLAEEIVVHP